jgi:hypothetical protein
MALFRTVVICIFGGLALACLLGLRTGGPEVGVHIQFKGRQMALTSGMRAGQTAYFPHSHRNNAELDTLSNWYDPVAGYVEIIRQDDPVSPTIGVALGFEFDAENGEYPYTPAHAVLQLKDFGWGGVEFSLRDTLNYTGISNSVSDDLQVEVEGFRNDTIWGRFSGLLVSGSGGMATVEGGSFRALVYRVQR